MAIRLGHSWPETEKLDIASELKTFIFNDLVKMSEQCPEDGSFLGEAYLGILGGEYYLVETVEEAHALFPVPRPYDRADVFNGYVALTLCTNNAGGDTYIIPANIARVLLK